MALSPRLELRHTQALVMTPQLQQAIKLLQLSNVELATYIERELEQNPLLERESAEGGSEATEVVEGPADGAVREETGFEEFNPPDSLDLSVNPDIAGREDQGLDADYSNEWDSDGPGDGGADSLHWQSSRMGESDEEGDVGSMSGGALTLREHLLGQLNVDIADPVERMIGTHLIDSLDDNGYFTGDLGSVADVFGCSVGRVAATLERLREFDPAGVFARDLADCLAMQLKEKNRLDPAMATLLDHLDMLARREFSELKRLCGVNNEDLLEMISEIKALNPKPAQAFDRVVAEPVTPDVLMRPRAGGGWIIELNAETLPRVLVNAQYYAVVARQARNAGDREYVTERFHSANWLVKALHQRAQTILKVAAEVVEQQTVFFSRGVEFLRPLTLRDVAEVLGVHESTVSRVTNNKYIATPRGVFEMKYFFTGAVARQEGGDQLSAASIRFRIKGLIERETPANVLSDDMICDILRGEGVDIARRTVAKYREALQIPSSVQRRREKSLSV